LIAPMQVRHGGVAQCMIRRCVRESRGVGVHAQLQDPTPSLLSNYNFCMVNISIA
jgi:hypothetical protein